MTRSVLGPPHPSHGEMDGRWWPHSNDVAEMQTVPAAGAVVRMVRVRIEPGGPENPHRGWPEGRITPQTGGNVPLRQGE